MFSVRVHTTGDGHAGGKAIELLCPFQSPFMVSVPHKTGAILQSAIPKFTM